MTMLYIINIIVVLTINWPVCMESSRILAAIPSPSYSHQVFFQLLWKELAQRGHEVVVMTTDPTKEKIANLKEIDLSSAYALSRKVVQELIAINDDKMAALAKLIDVSYNISEFELQLPEVQGLIKDQNEHFDLVMIECFFPAFYAFKHRFNCPFIGVLSTDATPSIYRSIGNPTHPILFPSAYLSAVENMSFKERVLSVVTSLLFSIEEYKIKINNRVNAIIAQGFGEGYPDFEEILASIDMLFVNNNPLISPIRPFNPNTISIAGGMHLKEPQALPVDLQTFLDQSTMGAVYFSLGSNVKSMELSNHTLKVLMDTFSDLPYNVLWKFENDSLHGKPKNVKIRKWLPQQDVLRHKNVKLFITQGGLQSLEEALFSHVPLVTMPFFADQEANSAKIAKAELGLNLNYKHLTVEVFKTSIKEVIENRKYANNIKKFALQIEDQPMTPLQKAVWWTEYVLRHKGAMHLRGPKIPLYQYYLVDVLAFLLLCFLAFCMVIILVWKSSVLFFKSFLKRIIRKVKSA